MQPANRVVSTPSEEQAALELTCAVLASGCYTMASGNNRDAARTAVGLYKAMLAEVAAEARLAKSG